MDSSTNISAAEYELLVMSFLSAKLGSFPTDNGIASASEVFHHKKYEGMSGFSHEIDLSFECDVVGSRILTLVECKCYSSKVKAEEVLEFLGRIRDIGAHKGILVTTTGFQKGAVAIAKAHNIALVIASRTNWSAETRSTGLEVFLLPLFLLLALYYLLRALYYWVESQIKKRPKAEPELEQEPELHTNVIHHLKNAVGLDSPAKGYTNCYPVSSTSLSGLTPFSRLPIAELDELKERTRDKGRRIDWVKEPPVAFQFYSEVNRAEDSPVCFGPNALIGLIITSMVNAYKSKPTSELKRRGQPGRASFLALTREECLRSRLVFMVGGDKDTCERLIESERKRHPEAGEEMLIENAIARLERDRSR